MYLTHCKIMINMSFNFQRYELIITCKDSMYFNNVFIYFFFFKSSKLDNVFCSLVYTFIINFSADFNKTFVADLNNRRKRTVN